MTQDSMIVPGTWARHDDPDEVQYFEEGGSFVTFLADMGIKPEGMTLDRIDNDGNYEPPNCRFVTPAINVRNSRSAKLTMKKVTDIRQIYGERLLSQRKIAILFNVTQASIQRIVTHKSWR